MGPDSGVIGYSLPWRVMKDSLMAFWSKTEFVEVTGNSDEPYSGLMLSKPLAKSAKVSVTVQPASNLSSVGWIFIGKDPAR